MMKILLGASFMVFMFVSEVGAAMFVSLSFNLLFLFSFFLLFSMVGIGAESGSIMGVAEGYFGMDNFSFFMILLSFWVVGLVLMVVEEFNKMKLVLVVSLLVIFVGFFSSLSLMVLMFFFELSLVPTFFLIIYWGGNFERVSAGIYMLMYMLFTSLPFLVYVFDLFSKLGTLNFCLVSFKLLFIYVSGFDYFIMFSLFLVKLPVFFFYVWLPKAHVEAPVYGSMILAAILLKLGGFGLIRMFKIFLYSSVMYSYYIFSVSFIGALLVSFLSLVQVDLKELVAYSSVVHMNFMLSAMSTMTNLGMLGALIMMIGHGLCSSGLFYMVSIYYEETGSRVIFFNKGMMNLMPSYVIWWFLMCVINFSFPLSMNFFSELFMIGAIISWDMAMTCGVLIISFMSGAYSLYLFSYIQHGGIYVEEKVFEQGLKKFFVLFLHVYPLLIFIFNMVLFC
uniref:NADH-ubiquinone oxidoreductase chain 4 n=1 Tax=Leptomyrmex pallens TaxID=611136 RepID=V5JF04_9HYME|nr:NADH dehydrogenase subunit 4 [Leptomyrmex pallens]AGL61399.1 NADH dehydrogenase subunit 4 [Leptomyrmex pallens]